MMTRDEVEHRGRWAIHRARGTVIEGPRTGEVFYSVHFILPNWEEDYGLSFADPASREAAIEEFFRPRDLGSLDPLDVGFDLRATKHPVLVPCPRAEVRVRLPRSKKYPDGKELRGHTTTVCHELHQAGFRAARS